MRRLLGASAALRWALALGALLAGAAAAEITSIATLPGGTSGQLEYNSRGHFTGAPGSSMDGSTLTVTEIRATTAAFGGGAAKSTFTKTGELDMAANAALILTSSGGYVLSRSSIVASAFFGDGANLTGIPSTGSFTAADAAVEADLAAHSVATSTHGATSVNTPSRIVMRDASGNFSAGTITAALSGNATTTTAFDHTPTAAQSGYLSRGVDSGGNAQTAFVETNAAGVFASTSPASAGALYSHNTSAAAHASGIAGNAATATALAANGTNCSAGSYAMGVDQQGNAEGCTAAGTGTVTIQGTPQVGQVMVSQGGNVISTGPVSVVGGTVTITGPANFPLFLSSQSFSGASSVSFTLTNTTNTLVDCFLNIWSWNTSAGIPRLTFQGDTTSGHYLYSAYDAVQGVAIGDYSSGSAAFIALAANNVPAAGRFSTSFSFVVQPNGPVDVSFGPTSTANGWNETDGGKGTYQVTGTANPTIGTITPSAGTITGFIRCMYMNY
jgi:hypothetical protein